MCVETHETFSDKIFHRYGAIWLNKVKEFTRLRLKRKKLECGLDYVVQCRDSEVIPKFARIKEVRCIRDCDEFFRVANKKLLTRVIADYRRKLMCTNQTLYELHLQLTSVLQSDLWQLLDTMTYNRTEATGNIIQARHKHKLVNLKKASNIAHHSYPHVQFYTENRASTHVDQKTRVINLSSQDLDPLAESILSRGLNFAPSPRTIPMETIVTSLENTIVRNKIPHRDAECLRQDVSTMLRKSKPPKGNTAPREMSALRDLRNNQNLLVLPADKGNAVVVVDTSAYEEKVTEMVSDTRIYQKVNYNPTSRVTTKTIKHIKETFGDNLLYCLRPHNPTAPKIYGLPKIHKPNWPLRLIVSQIDSPTYKLSKHLSTLLQPLTGKSTSYVKDSGHFVELLAGVQLLDTEVMVSFDVTSLFTNVPVEDTLNIISKLIEETDLPTGTTKLVGFCLRSGYFVWRGEYFLQLDGVAMGSPIAPVVANIFMEWFEKETLRRAKIRPRYWWRYVDDVFAVIDEKMLAEFSSFLNTIHPRIHFTVEEEKEGKLPFLDVLVCREPNGRLTHTVYRKPTHTDRYLRADSHHHPSHLSSIPRTLINRAINLCDYQYVESELNHVRRVLEVNGYSWRQSLRVVGGPSQRRRTSVERLPAYLPYLKGVTDRIGHLLRTKYGIRTIFRSPKQLREYVRSPKDKDPLNVPGVYMIPCDCGKNYIGETRRNIATRVSEHIRCMKNLDSKGSAVAEHAAGSDTAHFIRFDKVSVLAREKYQVPRKVREAIEISRRPNYNRDGGWTIPSAWKPVLHASPDFGVEDRLESDTVSVVCTQPYQFGDVSGDSEGTRSATEQDNGSPPRTSRQQRYSVRSAHRNLSSGGYDAAAHE